MALVRNKIGFHVGPNGNGANMTGIGEYLRQLDAANIPFVIKSVDNYGPIFEAVELQKTSNVPHIMVFRLSDRDDVYTFDTPLYHHPDYVDDPEGAADIHVNMTLAYLPPEFDKDRVWLELTNEVDRNKCEWLGRFALHAAKRLNGLGYKVALFGWASGEPEPIGWEEPSMLSFLRYCADNKSRCAVSVHEYSYIVTEILHQYPFKVGRFQYLFATCDKHNIGRPTVLVTEWGWTLNDVPEPTAALQDIDVVAKLYAQYDDILGAAIWYLGPGFGIADKTQRLIQPVADYTLNTVLEQNQIEIPVLPEVGDWKQYGEKMLVNVNLNTTENMNYIGAVRGLGNAVPQKVEFRWVYDENGETKYTAFELLGVDIPNLDLRGAEILINVKKPINRIVQVEVDCPGASVLSIQDGDTGVDVSYWNQ